MNELTRRYQAWKDERARLWALEDTGGPPASEWQYSDDEAVELLEAAMARPVYVEVASKWCLRHDAPIVAGANACYWSEEPYRSVAETPAPCIPVPLYIEARDP